MTEFLLLLQLLSRGLGLDLVWFGEKLLESCDTALREMIDDNSLVMAANDRCSPVFFKVMLDLIVSDGFSIWHGEECWKLSQTSTSMLMRVSAQTLRDRRQCNNVNPRAV